MKVKPLSERASELQHLKELDDDGRIQYIFNLTDPDEKRRALASSLDILPDAAAKKNFNLKFFRALELPPSKPRIPGGAASSSAETLNSGTRDEDILAVLNALSEEDRMLCILSLASPDDKIRAFNIAMAALPDEASQNAFAQRFNAKAEAHEERLEDQALQNAEVGHSLGDRLNKLRELKNGPDEPPTTQPLAEAPSHKNPEDAAKPESHQPSETKEQQITSPSKETKSEPVKLAKTQEPPEPKGFTTQPATGGENKEESALEKAKRIKMEEQRAKEEAVNKGKQKARSVFSLFGPRGSKGKKKNKPGDDDEDNLSEWVSLSVPNYLGPFASFASLFPEGNQNKLHDAASSVPYRGLVAPNGQLDFSIEQGEKLERYLKTRNISPLNASPADREVLKRADAARRESQLQALESSKYAMDEWQRKIADSVSRFRKETLIQALPEMMKAENPENIKRAFNDALQNNLLDKEAIKNNMQAISNDFMNYHEATQRHATNLIKDGREEEAGELIKQFMEKSKEIGAEGFLDEINNEEFSKKIEEMSNQMSEMIARLLDKITSQTRSSPAPA